MTGPVGRNGALAGVTVVEFGGLGPTPYAGMLLADLGADVVVLERPGPAAAPGRSPRHNLLNRGKRSLAINLNEPGSTDTVLALLSRADVMLEGYRPGVLERRGLSPARCWEANRSLVIGRMTGWGQTGPHAGRAAHDINYLSVTGLLNAIGSSDGPPHVPLNVVGDFGGGGTFLVIGVLAALRRVDRTGVGEVVDASILDGVLHLLSGVHSAANGGSWTDRRGSNLLDGSAPFYTLYETSDNRYLAVGAIESQFFAEFLRVAELDCDAGEQFDRREWPRVRRHIAERIASRTLAEWMKLFDGTDACVTPVLTVAESAHHPQIVARRSLLTDGDRVQSARTPRLSGDGNTDPLGDPPRPGQHTRDVLASVAADQ